MYLELYRGRLTPSQSIDWDIKGPVFGPLRRISGHSDGINLDFSDISKDIGTLVYISGLLYYDGMYWSTYLIYPSDIVKRGTNFLDFVVEFDKTRAVPF